MATENELKNALKQAIANEDKEMANVFAARLKSGDFEKELPQGNVLDQIAAPVEAVAKGLGGSISSGWQGIAELIKSRDLGSAVQKIKEVQNDWQMQAPDTQQGQRGMQVLQNTMNDIEALYNAAAGGTAGLANLALRPSQGIEGAQRDVQAIKEQGLGRALGQETLEATGSPLLATGAEVGADFLTDIAAGAVPVKAGIRGAGSALESASRKYADEAARYDNVTREATSDGIKQAVKELQNADPDQVIGMVNADPSFYNAMERLGITSEPIASFASQNPQFIAIENGLRSLPASALSKQAGEFISEVSKKADDLIEEYGGTLDKRLLTTQFEDDALKNIDDLYEAANTAYEKINESIDRKVQVEPTSTRNIIAKMAEDVGGVANLDPKLMRLSKLIKSKTTETPITTRTDPRTLATITEGGKVVENPTFGAIDQRRKEIGQALGRRPSGPFKDVETGQLKAVYAALTDDLNKSLDTLGMVEASDAAKRLVAQRKQLEDNLQSLLGKNLSKDITAVIGSATKGLSQGRTKQFVQTLDKVPKKYQQKVLVTALNDIFRGIGQGQESFSANNFLKFYNQLDRQENLKNLLYSRLPEGAGESIDAMARLARGINRAERNTIKTGLITSFFEPNEGLMAKMMGGAGKLYMQSKAGPAGTWMADVTGKLLSQSDSAAKSTSELLASPQFQRLIRDAVEDGVFSGVKKSERVKKQESALMKSQKYKKWAQSLPDENKASAYSGLLSYLLMNSSKEEQANE